MFITGSFENLLIRWKLQFLKFYGYVVNKDNLPKLMDNIQTDEGTLTDIFTALVIN